MLAHDPGVQHFDGTADEHVVDLPVQLARTKGQVGPILRKELPVVAQQLGVARQQGIDR